MNLILRIFIKYLTRDIVFKSKVKTYDRPKHGSSYGEPIEITLYWNTNRCEWTTIKSQVVEDHILKKLKPYIK